MLGVQGLARKEETFTLNRAMAEKKEQKGILKKFGKWGPVVGVSWIVLNIVLPLALLRVPAIQKTIVALLDKVPFDIPWMG